MSEPTAQSVVSLREIDAHTVRAICGLAVRPDQRGLVAENAVSIAQAHFAEHAWFRAIYADDAPVGFVMLEDNPGLGAEKPDYYLWRLMIDHRYQGLGFGSAAVRHVIDYVRTRPAATELLTSVAPGSGSPQRFYERLGFEATGEMDEGEAVLRLPL